MLERSYFESGKAESSKLKAESDFTMCTRHLEQHSSYWRDLILKVESGKLKVESGKRKVKSRKRKAQSDFYDAHPSSRTTFFMLERSYFESGKFKVESGKAEIWECPTA